MPYITPQELPEGDDCRPLSIPADSEWLALFGGALTELTKTWNWEFSGGLTVAETVDKMNEIIDGWYAGACGGCTLPGGGKIIRIGAGGVLEELGEDGEWGETTGDYVIPEPEPRTGGSAPDQNCLAAKNAVNVLHALYDNLEDSWNDNLDEAEAATAFTLTLIGLVGFEFAPITFGIVAFVGVVFGVLYQALEYLGADLWDEDFTKQMECFLLDCAMNDAGVVTFDWDCFMSHLNSLADSFGLSEVQLRLYLQVTYILWFIGGVGGLNLAASTTAITDDNCDFCGEEWCYSENFNLTAGVWEERPSGTCDWGAQWIEGQGWVNVDDVSLSIRFQVDEDTHITSLAFHTDTVGGGGVFVGAWENADLSGTQYFRVNAVDSGVIDVVVPAGAWLFMGNQNSGGTCGSHESLNIDSFTATGDGHNPFPDSNC